MAWCANIEKNGLMAWCADIGKDGLLAWCTDIGKDGPMTWCADIGKDGLIACIVCSHLEGWSYDLGAQPLERMVQWLGVQTLGRVV